MKKTICICAFLLFAFSGFTQAVDTAAVVREVDSLKGIWNAYSKASQYEKMIDVAKAAGETVEKKLGRMNLQYATCIVAQGNGFWHLNRYSEAENLYFEAKNIREKILGKSDLQYASVLHNLANLYNEMRRYESAEQYYLEAAAIRKRKLGENSPEYGSILGDMANLYYHYADYEKAEELNLKCISIFKETLGENNPNYSLALNKLAGLYYAIGRYEDAERLVLKAMDILTKLSGKENERYLIYLNNLAKIYVQLGKYDYAEQLLNDVIAARTKASRTEQDDYANTLNTLANLYQITGRIDDSENLYLKVLGIREKLHGGDHSEYAKIVNNLAGLYEKKGDVKRAEECYLKAIATRERQLGKGHPDYGVSLYHYAILLLKSNRQKEAIPFLLETNAINRSNLSKSVRHLSERELYAYTRTTTNEIEYCFSFSCNNTHIEQEMHGTFYDNALFYKGFLLTAANRVQLRDASDSATVKNMQLLKYNYRRLSEEYVKPIQNRVELSQIESETNILEKEIIRTVAGFGDAMREISWRDVQTALSPDEAAIEFVLFNYYNPKPTDSIIYAALLLKPGMQHPVFIPLCEEKQLRALLPATDGKLNNDEVNELYSNNDLYRLLWSPLESQLAGVRKVYYSPSGLLHRLNLAALPASPQAVLSDRYDMVSLGSTRQLALDNQNVTSNEAPTALIYGGIQFDMDSTIYRERPANHTNSPRGLSFVQTDSTLRGGTWNFLKWSEKEADNIQAALGQAGIKAKVVKGWQATEESFKQIGQTDPSPRILHISTHGFFYPDPANPQSEARSLQSEEPVFKLSDHPMIRSGLILAGANHAWKTGLPLGNREDGILTAYEISQIDLRNTELVVLSACETGLGHIEGNEGVYGLQRAFKIAGAQTLVMSLWQVPDYQTQELMTVFYQKLLTEKLPARLALRTAQDEMRRRHYEPYYWAGFVVVE